MSHVEMNPFVCQCSCHEFPRDDPAATRHNVPCCVGQCLGCNKRYTTEDELIKCQKKHGAVSSSIHADDPPRMPW